ncbi:MAG TPA: hypothetical protein VFW41_11800 [Gaiellaceae bacterium]|nr:hypothetical protein [Gaiellaceae bacterium]
MLQCEECGSEADERAVGWCAYLAGGDEDEPTEEVAIFCAACAVREFGWRS